MSRPPAHAGGRERDRHLDPVALAGLIVSAGRKRSAQPAPEVVARRVRVELAEQTEIDPGVRDRVIDIVVAETLPSNQE